MFEYPLRKEALWTITGYDLPEVTLRTPLWTTKLKPEGEVEITDDTSPFGPNTVTLTASDELTSCEPVETTSELPASPSKVIDDRSYVRSVSPVAPYAELV